MGTAAAASAAEEEHGLLKAVTTFEKTRNTDKKVSRPHHRKSIKKLNACSFKLHQFKLCRFLQGVSRESMSILQSRAKYPKEKHTNQIDKIKLVDELKSHPNF